MQEILEERHPLYYRGEWLGDVFPVCWWLCRTLWCKNNIQDIQESEKETMIKIPGILRNTIEGKVLQKMSSEENLRLAEEKSKKGFMRLGYGTVAYFYFHEVMLWMLFILCLLTIPSMIFFCAYKNGDWDKTHNVLE